MSSPNFRMEESSVYKCVFLLGFYFLTHWIWKFKLYFIVKNASGAGIALIFTNSSLYFPMSLHFAVLSIRRQPWPFFAIFFDIHT